MIRVTMGSEVIDPVLEMRFEGEEVQIFNGYNWYFYPVSWLNGAAFELIEPNEE